MLKTAKKVLIVDDMLYMRARLRKILEDMGFLVVGEAEDGDIAVQQYTDLRPDLVLLDVTMPEMNGVEVLRVIMKKNPKAVVIIVSGVGQKRHVQDAILAGAKNYIMKPFNDDDMCKILKPYL